MLGLIAATMVMLTLPPRYRSYGVVTAPSPDHVSKALAATLAPNAVAKLIEKHRLFPGASGDLYAKFLWNADLTPVNSGPTAELSFRHTDPAKAQAVTRELQVAMLDSGNGLELSSLASLPVQPERRPLGLPMITALAACAILGLATSLLLRRSQPASEPSR